MVLLLYYLNMLYHWDLNNNYLYKQYRNFPRLFYSAQIYHLLLDKFYLTLNNNNYLHIQYIHYTYLNKYNVLYLNIYYLILNNNYLNIQYIFHFLLQHIFQLQYILNLLIIYMKKCMMCI